MYEEDYEKVAVTKITKEVMDKYWLDVARRKIWTSKDGTQTPFSQLSLHHIKSIINGLMGFKNENCKFVIEELLTELTVRIKRKPPKYALNAIDQLVELASRNASEEELKDINNYKELISENIYDAEGRKNYDYESYLKRR